MDTSPSTSSGHAKNVRPDDDATFHTHPPLLQSNSSTGQPSTTGEKSRYTKDPHDLAIATPLIFAAYRLAHESHDELARRAITEVDFIARLRSAMPRSAFRFSYVAHQAFKLINPHGHGANGPRFQNETLSWFRQEYPGEKRLTAGFALLICAAKWWTYEHGRRSVTPSSRPLTTSDLDEKLTGWGFVDSEKKAITRLLRRKRP